MNSERFVIVGASIGGMTAAEELRKLTDAEIVLIDGDPDAPYDKTALSKAALLGETVPDIGMRSAEEFDARKITVLAGRWATALDAAAHELTLDDGERLHYSKLLIAAGAFPMVPFPVSDGANVHVLRTLDDARGLHAAFRDGTPHVTVIGSGLIGCEVASAARNLGLPTLLISVDTGPFSIVTGSIAIQTVSISGGVWQK